MSDYSNIKFERVDDLPLKYLASSKVSKPLAPVHIYDTLPFLAELKVGETIKFTIPEDAFTYKRDDRYPEFSANYYGSLKSALKRSFDTLSNDGGDHFVFRIVLDQLYIKRVDG